jgi:hypothetical protein
MDNQAPKKEHLMKSGISHRIQFYAYQPLAASAKNILILTACQQI